MIAHPYPRIVADELFRWSERLVGIEGAAIYLAGDDSLVCEYVFDVDGTRVAPVRELAFDEAWPIPTAFRTGRSQLWTSDEEGEAPALRAFGWRTALVLPLDVGDRVMGVYVAGWRVPHVLAGPGVSVLEGAASMAAGALERARLLTEVRRERDRWRLLLDSLPLPAVVVNRSSSTIDWANAATRDLLGEIDGQSIAKVVAHADIAGLSGSGLDEDAVIEGVFSASASPARFTLRDVRRDEHVIQPQVASLGEETAVVLLVDVTTEAYLDAHRARFVRMVGHHLRTPLTPLVGYVGMMAEDGAPETPWVDAIRDATDRLMNQVERLEQVAALRPASVDDMQEIRVDELVDMALDALPPEETPDIHLVGGDLGVLCIVDNAVAALRELLSNAVVHGESPIDIETEGQGEITIVTIRDSGPGISPEWAAAVFSPFLSAESDYLAPPGGGIGLGLTLARGLMEANQGGLRWEDDAFVIRLLSSTRPSR